MKHEKDTEKRFHWIEEQRIKLEKERFEGWLLDIGGGGEGIIGQLYGKQVVAIDPSRKELEEAGEGPLKIIMDARQMTFLDDTFHRATTFFTMMYIKIEEHQKVFEEIYRVIKPGGRFSLWDVKIPPFVDGEKDIIVVPLEINLEDKIIKTGYGTLWRNRRQDMAYFIALGKQVGFKVIVERDYGQTYCLTFEK